MARGAGAAEAAGGARGAGPRDRLRDRGHRRGRRAGHSRRPAGAAAAGVEARGKFHRRDHQPFDRRSRGARRSRDRPLHRPAEHPGGRRAARLPGNPLRRGRQALSAGREHRASVALRLGGHRRRARSARRHRLADPQGADEEPHPRDRPRADQDRGRAQASRGAAAEPCARRDGRIRRGLPLRGDRRPADRDRRDHRRSRDRPPDGPADLRRRGLRQDRGGAARGLRSR